MFMCSMCGMRKSELGSNPQFEFRSRRRHENKGYVEGISDWCSKCEALRFFFKSEFQFEPSTYLGERSISDMANSTLESTVKSWQQDCEQSRLRGNGAFQATNEPSNRLRYRDETKNLRQELLAALPACLPPGYHWNHSVRSRSVDRGRRRRQSRTTSAQRSKSAVNEPSHYQRSNSKARKAMKKGVLKADKPDKPDNPDKRDNLDIRVDSASNVPENELIAPTGEQATRFYIDSHLGNPKRFRTTSPMGKFQELEIRSPWHEEVHRRTNHFLAGQRSRDPKSKCANSKDGKPKQYPRSRFADSSKHEGSEEDVVKDVKGQSHEEFEEQINRLVMDKKNQIAEWERIRRCVEYECDRVKTEVNDLEQHQLASREMERYRNAISPVEFKRQLGGAQIEEFQDKSVKDEAERMLRGRREKTIGDALDEKLGVMLDTLRENSQIVPKPSSSDWKPQLFEPTAPNVSQVNSEKLERPKDASTSEVQAKTTSPEVAAASEAESETLKPKRILSKLHVLVSTVQRAEFRGFPEDPQRLLQKLSSAQLMERRDPPAPQFGTLPCTPSELINLLSLKREVLEPRTARPLKICRSPIFCPDADCKRMFFISDFNEHLTHEHPSLAMERISSGQAKTFFLDTRVTLLNKPKCNMVYFVKDKFVDKNTNRLPELLPVLVMTARLEVPVFFSGKKLSRTSSFIANPENEVFLIWLTSIRPDDTKIIGTISVWPTMSQPVVEYLTVHTNDIYSIRSGQKLKNVFNSNRIMALPGNVISRMTNDGKSLLAVQVLIH